MRISVFVAALVSILNGCAPVAVLPEVAKSEVTTAQVVVSVPCITEVPAAPAWAVDALPPNANEFEKARSLVAEHIQRKQYVDRLLAIISACK